MLAQLEWMVEDGQRLAECRHDHPQAVLGPHPLDNGKWAVRVWMPEADRVELIGAGAPQAGDGRPEQKHWLRDPS